MQAETVLDALGDRSRRAIVELLRTGPQPVGKLAEQLPISRPAVSQHLRVLKEAGLVDEVVAGTRHIYQLDRTGLELVRDYLDRFWDTALSRFAHLAAEAAETAETAETAKPATAPSDPESKR